MRGANDIYRALYVFSKSMRGNLGTSGGFSTSSAQAVRGIGLSLRSKTILSNLGAGRFGVDMAARASAVDGDTFGVFLNNFGSCGRRRQAESKTSGTKFHTRRRSSCAGDKEQLSYAWWDFAVEDALYPQRAAPGQVIL